MNSQGPTPKRHHWLRLTLVLMLVAFAPACALIQGQGVEESLSTGWVVRWQRVGGIAGFCDMVTISAAGEATVWSCRAEPATPVGETDLTAEEQATLAEWLATYSSMTIIQSDPATADSMTVTLDFIGDGDQALPERILGQMDALAQALLRRANP